MGLLRFSIQPGAPACEAEKGSSGRPYIALNAWLAGAKPLLLAITGNAPLPGGIILFSLCGKICGDGGIKPSEKPPGPFPFIPWGTKPAAGGDIFIPLFIAGPLGLFCGPNGADA